MNINLSNIPGTQKINNQIIILDKSIDTVHSIISKLSNDEGITFFDYFHPQWSDPGAYVSLRNFKGDFIYKLGNHGWSSDWYYTSIDRLSRYLYKNLEYNNNSITIEEWSFIIRNNSITNERFWANKLNEIDREANKYVVYEVNGYHVMSLNEDDNKSYVFDESDEYKFLRFGKTHFEELYLCLTEDEKKYVNNKVEILRK